MPTIHRSSEKKDKDLTTKDYVLLTGKHYGRDAEGNEIRYEKGDVVPLTKNEYSAFKDKFEEVESRAAKSVSKGPAVQAPPANPTSSTPPAK